MKIIIKIKDTATLDRIEQFNRALGIVQRTGHQATDYLKIDGYSDVIESISKEV